MIVLTTDTAAARVPIEGSALCVHHEKCEPPRQFGKTMPWRDFSERFQSVVDTYDNLVLVGLNKIITPANRVKVGGMVLRPRKWRRHSVDQTLFVSEPWRAWFHFGCVGSPYHGYSYSYLAETDWRAFGEGKRERDPFSLEALIGAGAGVIRSEYRRLFDVSVRVVPVAAAVHAEYAAAKEAAFTSEHTLSGILRRLEGFVQRALPERRIPSTARLFTSTQHEIVRTDLMVDEFLTARLLSLADLTNQVAARFYGAD